MKSNKKVILLLAAGLMLAGCSKKDNQEDLYLGEYNESEQIDDVANFNAFNEEEVSVPTTAEPVATTTTLAPETEPYTEPQTEKETETEDPSYQYDYDFSDFTILQALFSGDGGIGSSPYKSTVTQDAETMTRVQVISTKDDKVKVTLEADRSSGKTNKAVTFDISLDNADDYIRQVLLSFKNGITEENYQDFMAGAFSGRERAPYIGLTDVSVNHSDEHVVVRLQKASQIEGDVPCWRESVDAEICNILKGCKTKIELTGDTQFFLEIFKDMEFGTVSITEASMSSIGTTYDETGTAVGNTIQYNSKYACDTGDNFDVDISYTGSDDDGMRFECCMSDLDDEAILYYAERIYQFFFNEAFDMSVTLEQPYSVGRATVEKTEAGFRLFIR